MNLKSLNSLKYLIEKYATEIKLESFTSDCLKLESFKADCLKA